ncbi:UNVERIFIED_CONTAM: hypothetical protein GTU68_049489 [Idotea baltica]|nr:hypothetical protein [Idotea baltica]
MAYKAIENYPDKRIFFLSEMIHNPHVNKDLLENGIRFLMDTHGNPLINWDEVTNEDVVLIPAFGTTLETKEKLNEIGLLIAEYDTTCPFVAKVWNRSDKIAQRGFSLVVHGKPSHEETRATFSHAKDKAPAIIVKNLEETKQLAKYMLGELPEHDFYTDFEGRFSADFKLENLNKLGVVNQTTMLATETQEIANYLKGVLEQKFGGTDIKNHFADTRDTLCYATNDNQQATYALLNQANADLAIVVGGYNSSNTTHLVELCEEQLPTYFISSASKISDVNSITHFNIRQQKEITTNEFLAVNNKPLNIIITSGASCPDSMVETVIMKLKGCFKNTLAVEDVLKAALN